MQKYKIFLLSVLVAACSSPKPVEGDMEYARWFSILDSTSVVVFSPSGGADTLRGPVQSLVCMSTSYVGFLDAIGEASVVKGVSGLKFAGTSGLDAIEVGYDANLDFEAVLKTRPDYLLTYAVGSVEPAYLAKLRELGIKAVVLSEHLENHPLARAEYVKLFGALTGRLHQADSVFSDVRDRYLSLVQPSVTCKVLVNVPYADSWYIPGGENYMTRLISDAGGEVLGAVPGRDNSSVISLEKAYSFALEADFWLNTGWCSSLKDMSLIHPVFKDFNFPEVWNNTLLTTPGGGNMFWETGPVRPDLILHDLVRIFSPTSVISNEVEKSPFNYYFKLK